MQPVSASKEYQPASNLKVVRKHCLNPACNKQITNGKANKKFCNERCRATYNNTIKANVNNYMKNVKNALSKNRRIIQSLLSENEETVKVSRDILLNKGYNFKYHTNTQTNKKGQTYRYCYEYGYLPLDSDTFLLVLYKE